MSNESLDTLLAKKQELEQLINSKREEERGNAVDEARRLIALFQLTVDELFSAKKPAKKSGNVLPPKYKDPNSDKTWSGKGRSPAWFDSNRRNDFLI